MPALDYSRVAALYDRYCVFDADLPYWQSVVEGVEGEVLELMAGTGRVSLPLAERGARLVCIDSAPSMLARLRARLEARSLAARLLAADATRLPLNARFPLVLLPFQGLSELATRDQRLALFQSVAGCLSRGGRFVCTSHDPESRLRSVDGRWHELGRFEDPDGSVLELALRCQWHAGDNIVTGVQRLRVARADGTAEPEIRVPLRFALPPLDEVRELAADAGLRLVELHGDHGRGPYRPGMSPCMIVVLEADR